MKFHSARCGIKPAHRHAKRHLALRHPSHVRRLQGHPPVIKDDQINERNEGFELYDIRCLVQIIVAKHLKPGQAGAQREHRHGYIAERKGRGHLQRTRRTARDVIGYRRHHAHLTLLTVEPLFPKSVGESLSSNKAVRARPPAAPYIGLASPMVGLTQNIAVENAAEVLTPMIRRGIIAAKDRVFSDLVMVGLTICRVHLTSQRTG